MANSWGVLLTKWGASMDRERTLEIACTDWFFDCCSQSMLENWCLLDMEKIGDILESIVVLFNIEKLSQSLKPQL